MLMDFIARFLDTSGRERGKCCNQKEPARHVPETTHPSRHVLLFPVIPPLTTNKLDELIKYPDYEAEYRRLRRV